MFWFFYSLFAICSIYAQTFEIHGHRGCGGVWPGNTLAAFEAASEEGVDVLELDLQITSDGVVVIHHDYSINEQLIKDLTLSQVKLGDGGIPTLRELFDLVRDKAVRLNLEIKQDPRNPTLTRPTKELVQTVVNVVREEGFVTRVYYSSFSPEILTEVRNQDPDARIIFIIGNESLLVAKTIAPQNPMQLILGIASSFRAEALAPEDLILDDEMVFLLKNAGFKIIPWTINDKERALMLMKMGVDGLISDYPQMILQ